jgi:hypothetical protein
MNALDLSRVKVARRFTRSVRVDTDIGNPAALEGYVLTQSAVDALLVMARHRDATEHAAFTWTGPYGSGKSSLAIALAALLSGTERSARAVFESAAQQDALDLLRSFRAAAGAWSIVPVVGQRSDPERVVAGAIKAAGLSVKRAPNERFAAWIGRIASATKGPGIAIIIDEMGKFLEHAALDGGDIHVFQELAEVSARSKGRLLLVGILHQAFDEYAHRLSRQARDEWLKVQGRYVDLTISLAGDEQIELIARAIDAPGHSAIADDAAQAVAIAVRGGRAENADALANRLAACWPLHPITAALLGPLSRRRFGQSQRSIFGFLTSAEPFGFQEYISGTEGTGGPFGPERLWNYLRANLEPAILASPDGHRWSTAVDAVERCETCGGSAEHLAILKTIALLDLFKDRSGLKPSPEIVRQVIAGISIRTLETICADLIRWSVIVFRKHSGSYAIYAGSDFDIERAIDDARSKGVSVDFKQLAAQAALQPVLAKRHYELTGALRWFEVAIAPLHEAEERVRNYKPAAGSAGLFLVLVSANAESRGEANRIVGAAVTEAKHLVIAGWTRDSYRLRELGAELAALEHVRANRPELEGDAIARREVDSRISRIAADLDDRLADALELVDWHGPADADLNKVTGLAGPAALSVLASRLADWRYPGTPRLRNELVNRTKPSSNAAAATRSLLRAMVEQRGVERLGLKGFPPEAGLFVSLLEATGLYRRDSQGSYSFVAPGADDECRLGAIWDAADAALQANVDGRTFAAIFAIWAKAPFGVRDGLMSILGIAYLLTRSERLATYLDDVFRPQLDSFLVDRLLQDPSAVRMRLVELSDVDTRLITGLARRFSTEEPVDPSPLEVARALVRNVRALPNWTLRTSLLSDNAIALRNLGRNSSDPNQLLFEDLPRKMKGKHADGDALAETIHGVIGELQGAYAHMLTDLAATLFTELRFKLPLTGRYAPLHKRAETVRGLSGNFRLDALATRLASFDGDLSDVEGIASLAANKPPRDWVDRDLDAAKIELAALAQQFLRAEGLAHLKGRTDGRVSMTVYISDPSFPAPAAPHIELDAEEREEATAVAGRIGALLEELGVSSNIALGALAQLCLSLADDSYVEEARPQAVQA